MLFFINL